MRSDPRLDGIPSSDKTLAFATSAKRPERKSELYDEMFTISRLLRIARLRSVNRAPIVAVVVPAVPAVRFTNGRGGIASFVVGSIFSTDVTERIADWVS